MKRNNIFKLIHKGLRHMLYDIAIQLQKTDFNNQEEAETILEKISTVMDLFDKHAFSEDNFVLTALKKLEPAVTNIFEHEHVLDHQLSDNMRSLLKSFKDAATDEEKINSGSAISIAFVEFMVFNLKHMAKEEDVLNKLLWKYFTDEQLGDITKDIVAHIPNDYLIKNNRWMMRSISNSDAATWLIDVKNNAPGFVFENMMQLAVNELGAERWSKVQESITEGALLA